MYAVKYRSVPSDGGIMAAHQKADLTSQLLRRQVVRGMYFFGAAYCKNRLAGRLMTIML